MKDYVKDERSDAARGAGSERLGAESGGATGSGRMSPTGQGARSSRLFTPAFTALLVAQLCSLMGEAVTRFVLPLHLLNLTGSATLYGAVAAAAFIPYILLMPVGGVVADRARKQRFMAVLDAALALVAVGYLVASRSLDVVVITFAALMLLYAGQALYQPTVQASVPALVDEAHVTQAVAMVSQVSTLTSILGPVLGGAVFGFFGIAPIMELAAVGFAASCALIMLFVRIPSEGASTASRTSGPGPLALFVADTREATAFLAQNPIMWHGILVACLLNLVLSAGITVGSPYIVTEYLGLSNQLMGIAEAALGAGGLAGGLIVALRPERFSVWGAPRLLLLASMGLVPIAIALACGAPAYVAFAVLVVCYAWLFGCCSCITIVLVSFLQKETPGELVGKVIAFTYAGVNCATPIGQLVYGIAYDYLLPALIIGVMFAGMVLTALVWAHVMRRDADARSV